MIEAIRVFDIRETIYWADAFRVLGIKRSQEVLAETGVPVLASSQPFGLSEAALHFWRHNWEGISHKGLRVDTGSADPAFRDNYRLALEALIQNSFAIMENHYGSDIALNLYLWVKRFFIDQDDVNLWFTWSTLFSLAFEVEPDLFKDPEVVPRIRETIAGHFGRAVEVNDAKALRKMEGIPLSTLEQRMIALEVTQPNDFPEVDLTGLVRTLMQYNHAYQVWNQFHRYLSTSDQEALLWWAYEQANTLGISAEDINIPSIA
ncbi:MAG TPA: hypothetical protein VJS64_16335 [Pyrinomonadaceae bacterium]|nr:hypothetical protein [Pyrinomonadaceae bacterium]